MTTAAMKAHWQDPQVRLRRQIGVLRRRSARRVARYRANGVPEDLIQAEEQRLADRVAQLEGGGR